MEGYVKNVKKIAIVRANALGDFIVTLPAIYAISATYPMAEIILLGKPWHAGFLAGQRTPIDRVIVIPILKGLREEMNEQENKNDVDSFFEDIKKEKLDIAIHFQGKGIAANSFINKLGAKITAGFTCPEAEMIDRSIPFFYYQHEVIRYLEVVSLIGAKPSVLEPVITIFENDLQEARNFLSEHRNDSFVAIHPCGTDLRRMWTKEKFAQLADALAEENLIIIFTGSTDDSRYMEEIIGGMKKYAINACGRLSLGGTAALFSMSKVMIGIDTGPLHLARAVGSRTVGLYWAPNIINWAPLTRAKHRPVISWNMNCPQCEIIPNDPFPFQPVTASCTHSFSFIENISVKEVIHEVKNLLSGM
ncbi:MAG: glycosyltransferase family 9 protein [Cytophagaceae bacterium]